MNPRKIKFLLTAFVLLSALPLCMSCSTKSTAADVELNQEKPEAEPIKVLNSQEAKKLLAQQPNTIILDVRTPPEFAGGHLQNAQLINFNAPDFKEQIKRLDPTQPYLVYCAVGGRSKLAADIMHKMGFKQVYNVSQGFNAIKEAGVPVK
ncbi:hypothetical protein AAE02nite_16670 [Adhaeribacter aerolatus]|uniref:Rhodanese domain-containing protein n=1 Tax=Adhaeribacter aerolatus TaxID=670289 RepID=A0A512AWB8_9BACT|nr:rhodanese-like domain-containing protein [Adhaeribacter aerolatus]GEO04003.1 hypothetical protein AAE02nite_16670 [Adhaeribacter aerolatus]